MDKQTHRYLKQKLSVDELEIQSPPLSLVQNARLLVEARKSPQEIKSPKRFLDFFNFEISIYKAGFAALFIVVAVLYVSKQKYAHNEIASSNDHNKNTSINSSTVLASLTQYTNNKASVNSSTVLTSIITFVAKN